jgi:voltage-gated potassium channel
MRRLPFNKINPLVIWFAVIVSINLFGVIGFMIVEKLSLFDALYMTIITITTIGYSEVKALSHEGRVFNIIFIITSFTTFTIALAGLTKYIASGEMFLYLKNRKLMKALEQLNNHVIVCGFGRNGQQAAKTLKSHKLPFVALDYREKNIDDYLKHDPNLVYIKGDVTDDALLIQAGIERASGLICALPTDADNVFIVLSARALNPTIQIISRSAQASSIAKLKKAGANNVIMPDRIAGTHMATLLAKPDVIEFIDYLSGEEGESINIESVAYENLHVSIQDTTLKEVMEWEKTGMTCIGVKDKDGKFMINPPQDTLIGVGMKVIVLGSKDQIRKMKHNLTNIK